MRAGRRAWGFEKRLKEKKGSSLARRCWEEIRDRRRGGGDLSDWEKERSDFFEERVVSAKEVEKRKEEGDELLEKVWRRERERCRRKKDGKR